MTDGDTNTGSSILSVAGSSRALSIPIFSIITGSESSLPDLSLDEVFAPSFVLQEERVTINWQASNRFKSPQSTSLTLLANGQKVVEKPISFFGEESISGNLSWLPDNEGEIEFEIILGQVKGEIYKNNNTQRVNTRIEKKTIRALIVDSFPRWEYRYLRNALNRDPGVDLSCILFHPGMNPSVGENYIQEFPQDEASLAPFDVIFLGDVGLNENELNLTKYPPDKMGFGIIKLHHNLIAFGILLSISIIVSFKSWQEGSSSSGYLCLSFILPFLIFPIGFLSFYILDGFNFYFWSILLPIAGVLTLGMFVTFGFSVAQGMNDLKQEFIDKQLELNEKLQSGAISADEFAIQAGKAASENANASAALNQLANDTTQLSAWCVPNISTTLCSPCNILSMSFWSL